MGNTNILVSLQKKFLDIVKEWIDNPMFIKKIIHPDFVEYFNEKWADLINNNPSDSYEYKITDPEGNERWIYQTNTGIFDNQGKIIAIEGLCRNITEHKKAEKALRKSEEQLRIIFKAAKEVSFIITNVDESDPVILEFSPGAENIFGYSKDEMIGKQVSVLYTHKDINSIHKIHNQMKEGKEAFSGEISLL